jgi:multidrug resistance protein
VLSIATLAPTADLRSGIGSVARQVGQRDAGQLTLPSFKASMTSTSSPPALCTLISLCAISVLPLSIFLPSLPNIAADFHTDYAFATLALSGYALISAGIELVTGPLSDRFGRRPLLLTGLAVFVVGSIGCAVSTNAWTFLAFRALQAPITSCYPLSMAVIRDTTGRQKTASRIGYVVMAAALAPMLGPTLGGTLDRFAGWRAIFWSLALLGTTLLVMCWFDLEETHTKTSDTFRQRLLAYTALLRERRFWGYSLCMAFSTGTFYAFLSGAPLAAKVAFELPTAQLGFYMGTITAGFVLGSSYRLGPLPGRGQARNRAVRSMHARWYWQWPLKSVRPCGRNFAATGFGGQCFRFGWCDDHSRRFCTFLGNWRTADGEQRGLCAALSYVAFFTSCAVHRSVRACFWKVLTSTVDSCSPSVTTKWELISPLCLASPKDGKCLGGKGSR